MVDDFFVFVINGDLPRLTFHKMGRVRTEDGKMIYLTQCGAPFQTWSFRLRRDHAELLGDPCRHCWPGSYTPTKSA